MSRGGLRRLGGLLGAGVCVGLGCQRAPAPPHGDDGLDTGGSGTDDGASDGGSGTATSDTDTSGDGGSSTGDGGDSSSTDTQDTGTTTPGCIPLADIAAGIGGFALDGEAEDCCSGRSVSGAGDISGDGLADVVVAGSGASLNCRTYVVFGKPDTSRIQLADVAQGVGGFALSAEPYEDFSVRSVSGAGDVNGDGLADVIAGAPHANPNGLYLSGRTYVVFGKADTNAVDLTDVAQGSGGFALDGQDTWHWSGASVSGAGDVNGDGLADVIIGAPRADPNGHYSGKAYVVFGKADTDPVSLANVALGTGGFSLDGEAEDDEAGFSVSAAGDVNGDGLADVILGAPGPFPPGTTPGHTFVVFGKADTEPISLADVAEGNGGFVMNGEAEGDRSGQSVSGAGDVNDDGLADVLVGAYMADPNGLSAAGRSYVVFGKADTGAMALADVAQGIGGFVLNGEAAGDRSGHSVSGAGDMNDDGLADVVVGAPSAEPNGHLSGRTYVVFGKEDTAPVSLANVGLGTGGFALDGEPTWTKSGFSVSGAPDVNGDGLADVVIGAYWLDVNGPLSGRTYVVFGGDLACTEGS